MTTHWWTGSSPPGGSSSTVSSPQYSPTAGSATIASRAGRSASVIGRRTTRSPRSSMAAQPTPRNAPDQPPWSSCPPWRPRRSRSADRDDRDARLLAGTRRVLALQAVEQTGLLEVLGDQDHRGALALG